jgi:hypothetical protein
LLRLSGTQTVPLSSENPLDDGVPGPPGPPTSSATDGGRALSLSYTYKF